MIPHDAKTQYFSEVQRTELSNHIDHPVFIGILKRKSIQCGFGHDMVHRSLFGDYQFEMSPWQLAIYAKAT
jgi:hypothetical protein